MYKYCSRMNGYSVVSSVHLTESPQLYSLASVNCLPRRLSIVLRTRTIKFKWDPFSMGIISYVSWGIRLHEGGSFHTFRLIRCGMKICPAWSAVRKTSNININD